jgi:hypothetical protein
VLRVAVGERDRLVVKPAVGKSGNEILFGKRTPERDWLSAIVRAARKSPLVLQHRVEPARLTMPFRDRDSGQQATAQVPFVLSPFIIDGAAASVLVRHMGPGVSARDVVINTRRGARPNTVLLVLESSGRSPAAGSVRVTPRTAEAI